MKLIYNIKQKGRLILLLLFFLVIEFVSSSSQKENVQQLDTAINEIYSDRLIAHDLIFRMSEVIHEQKDVLLTANDQDSAAKLLSQGFDKINYHIRVYNKTHLTRDEALVFARFKAKIEALSKTVSRVGQDHIDADQEKKELIAQLDSVAVYLSELSGIQLDRSEDLREDSHNIVSFSCVIEQLNWALFIVTSLCI